MELTGLICDMFLCRLCGEENENGTEIFPTEENGQDLSELINKYLPLKVENDRKYPTKICPGCNIQLEATKSFMDLIVQGQMRLRQLYKIQQDKLHRQEKQRLQLEEALKNVNPSSSVDTYTIQSDETGEKFLIQIFSQGPLFPPDHELALKVEGLSKPRRKRGRPPKPLAAQEEAQNLELENEKVEEKNDQFEEVADDGKRRRRIKVPTRYSEAIQGKELDKVFKQEGVIDEESVSGDDDRGLEEGEGRNKVEEVVIGRLETESGEDLGQPVVINKNSHKTRAKSKSGPGQVKRRRKYQCEICGREFLHHGRYEVHRKMHEVEYTCGEENCDFETDQRPMLEQHQQDTGHKGLTVTEKVDKYGTLQLPTGIKAPAPAAAKGAAPAPRKDFACEKCGKRFSCKQNYEVHAKAVHAGERPFACDSCGRRFSYANSLKVHRLLHAPGAVGGAGGGAGAVAAGQYRCPSCPKRFRHPSSLQYHRDSAHADGRRFVCNTCDRPFKHRQLLQRHQLVHSDERPHRCASCDAAFKTRANLLHHAQTVHAGRRAHWCSLCDKSFAHKTALKLHQRWHAGVRPYQCDFCKKAFSQKGNLAEHRRIHTGEKPYQCDHCGRAFTTSSQFRLHKKRHLDERPHKCEYCQKSFLHKVTLRCHMRRHFDERPFQCQHCPKTFPEAWALKKHERLHTGEKPHKCDICAKAFADSSNMAKHRRTHRTFREKQILFVTCEKDAGDAIVTYIEPQDSLVESNEIISMSEDDVKTVQLQQLIDQEGNPISFMTQDGQQVKVVTSSEDGQENIQGLLPDGTLVPISLTTFQDKRTELVETVEKTTEAPLEGHLLPNSIPNNIQFISDDDSKVNNIEFVTDDNQTMCLVTTFNIDDSINPEYLNMP